MTFEEYKELLIGTHGGPTHIKKDIEIILRDIREDADITEQEYEELFSIAEEVYGYPL